MSEILNLIKKNPDSHVYSKAAEILSKKLNTDYSFVIQVWDHEMPQKTKYKKILISTSDEAHQIPKESNDDSFAYIFKQYIPMSNPNIPHSVKDFENVSAIPLCHLEGVKNLDIPINQRAYDWSWMGQYDPYRRANFRTHLDALCEDPFLKKKVLWYEGWNNGADTGEYSDTINNTKIILVPQGSGSLESFRFFEAMMAGCIILTKDQPAIDFYNVAPCIKIDSWHNSAEIIHNIINSPEEISFLSEQGKRWYQHFCSPEGLANYMYRTLKRKGIDV